MEKDKFGLTVKIKEGLKSIPNALRNLNQLTSEILNFVRMILAILDCSVRIVVALSILRFLAGVALNYSKEQLISAAA
ncbi:MAG: hypothetical protein R3Y10_00840 [Ferrimonas sp.]